MSPVFHQLYYQKATAPSLCARTNSRRSRATLIDRKNIIAAEPYLICWRALNARKMIGLKAYNESLLMEAWENNRNLVSQA